MKYLLLIAGLFLVGSCSNREKSIPVTFVLPDGYVGPFFINGNISRDVLTKPRPSSIVLHVNAKGEITDPMAAWVLDNGIYPSCRYESGTRVPLFPTNDDTIGYRDGFPQYVNDGTHRQWFFICTERELGEYWGDKPIRTPYEEAEFRREAQHAKQAGASPASK